MKGKFNLIDLLIVLVILAVIIAGVLLLGGGQGTGGETAETKKVQLVVEFTARDETFINLPQVGDIAMIGVKEKMETVVTNVEILPATRRAENIVDGWAGTSQLPGRYDVRITCEGEGVETNETVSINGVAARVGEEAFVKSKNWAGAGFVVDLDTL